MSDETGTAMRRAVRPEPAIVLVACLALSALFTWPWVPNRASVPTTYQGSGELYAKIDTSMWTYMLAWGARHPMAFYDAPVLLPVEDPLTANDPRLTEGIWSIPVFRLFPPVLAWGLSIWIALALTAAGSYYAGVLLTGSRWGGAAVTILFAFGMFRANHVCHIEGIFVPFLALALATMARFLEAPVRRASVAFALALCAATIEYSYFAVMLALTLPVPFVWGLRRRRIPWKQGLAPLALAAALTVLLLAPVALQYASFHRDSGTQRTIAQVERRSADHVSWITGATGRVLPPFGPEGGDFFDQHLFPGFIASILGVIGARRLWKKSPEMLLAGVLAFVLSFGTMRALFWQMGIQVAEGWTPYGLLYEVLLPLQAIRSPARFGALTHLVLAFAGALAIARIAASSRGRVLAALVLAVSFVEARSGMHAVTILPERAGDPTYRWLAEQPGTFAVMEAPMGLHAIREQHLEEAETMLVSLVHGRPTPNGTMAADFPLHDSIAVGTANPAHAEAKRLLRALGIRFVVTRDSATEGAYRAAGYRCAFASPAGIAAFEVESPLPVPADPREVARRLSDDPFYAESRAARESRDFRLSAPERIVVQRGRRFNLPLTVRNDGNVPWAGDSRIYVGGRNRGGDVMVGIRLWRSEDSDSPPVALGPGGEALVSTTGLPVNLLPGESVQMLSMHVAPIRPGRYLAELDVVTRGGEWMSPPDRPPATVRVQVD